MDCVLLRFVHAPALSGQTFNLENPNRPRHLKVTIITKDIIFRLTFNLFHTPVDNLTLLQDRRTKPQFMVIWDIFCTGVDSKVWKMVIEGVGAGRGDYLFRILIWEFQTLRFNLKFQEQS